MKTRVAGLAPAARLVCDLAAFLVPAIVYIASASHEPASWDTAELQGVPYILGISHPTGFPFYVLLGFVWSHVVSLGTIAFRMNVLSAIAIAGAVATAYGVALQLGTRRPIALMASLWYAFSQDVWAHGIRAEAQDLAVLCEALAIFSFVRWMKGDGDRWFAAAFALVGLGMAAHPNAIWVLPGLAIGALTARHRPSLRLTAASLGLMLLGLMFYLYVPLRSAYIVSHGLDPTRTLVGVNGGIFWNYNNPSTPGGLMLALTGSESGTPGYFLNSFNPVHAQDALWALILGIGQQFGAYVLVLAIVGVRAAWKRDWRVTLFLCVACTAALLFSVTYADEGDVGRYRLLALWLTVPLIGALAVGATTGLRAGIVRVALLLFLTSGTAYAFAQHVEFFSHDRGEGGRWMIDSVRPLVPAGSVIVTDWLDATSLAYGAYVDGSLPSRIIVSGYDPARVGIYRLWAQHHRVFLLVDPSEVDKIPGTKPPVMIDAYHELIEVKK